MTNIINNLKLLTLALCVEYDGNAYHGWQKQKKLPSIQVCLENALSKVANELITVFCASRTDVGVHSIGQIAHFKTNANRSNIAWTLGVNANLPTDIVVHWVVPVAKYFHARFSAIARRYRYIIYNYSLRPAIFFSGVAHYFKALDIEKMIQSSQYLIGENNFSSFHTKKSQSCSSWRNLHHIKITRYDRYVVIDIKANAFIHHMIRNIVGSLIEVGCGNQPENWIAYLLAQRNRTTLIATAPAKGLYLTEVYYPSNFSLPSPPSGPLFLNF